MTKKEFEEYLQQEYPLLFVDMHGDWAKTCLAHGIGVEEGWRNIIENIARRLEPILEGIANKGVTPPRAFQVKQKFAQLRFYMSYGGVGQDPDLIKEIEDIISVGEAQSLKICEQCGAPGTQYISGWIFTLCESCADKSPRDLKMLE